MDTIDFYLKLKTKDLAFYCAFFDGFEGLISQRTPNPPKGDYGILRLMVSPNFVEEFKKMIKKLKLETVENVGAA